MNGLLRSLAIGLPLVCTQASAQFSINFSFADPLTVDEQTAFTNAVDTWESLIGGYQPGLLHTGVDITVATSGPATTPTKIFSGAGFVTADESHLLVTPATLASLDQATLELFFTREIGTALGVGSLWQFNGLYTAGSGEYTGAKGLLAFQSEFSPSASFVPVELLTGSSDIYWDEIDLAAGLTNASGQHFGNDIMTSSLGPNIADTYFSQTTLESLEDIGYSLASKKAVPEPSSLILLVIGGLGISLRRKRA